MGGWGGGGGRLEGRGTDRLVSRHSKRQTSTDRLTRDRNEDGAGEQAVQGVEQSLFVCWFVA